MRTVVVNGTHTFSLLRLAQISDYFHELCATDSDHFAVDMPVDVLRPLVDLVACADDRADWAVDGSPFAAMPGMREHMRRRVRASVIAETAEEIDYVMPAVDRYGVHTVVGVFRDIGLASAKRYAKLRKIVVVDGEPTLTVPPNTCVFQVTGRLGSVRGSAPVMLLRGTGLAKTFDAAGVEILDISRTDVSELKSPPACVDVSETFIVGYELEIPVECGVFAVSRGSLLACWTRRPTGVLVVGPDVFVYSTARSPVVYVGRAVAEERDRLAGELSRSENLLKVVLNEVG